MKEYFLVFEYNSKKFMDINKIITFKKNLEKIKKEKKIKFVFCGNATNEELASFMSYFNRLVGEQICDVAISFKTKELISETGINNKQIKLSARKAKEITSKKLANIISEYYLESNEETIKVMPTVMWEEIILDI